MFRSLSDYNVSHHGCETQGVGCVLIREKGSLVKYKKRDSQRSLDRLQLTCRFALSHPTQRKRMTLVSASRLSRNK